MESPVAGEAVSLLLQVEILGILLPLFLKICKPTRFSLGIKLFKNQPSRLEMTLNLCMVQIPNVD